jgi:hypothetical protein
MSSINDISIRTSKNIIIGQHSTYGLSDNDNTIIGNYTIGNSIKLNNTILIGNNSLNNTFSGSFNIIIGNNIYNKRNFNSLISSYNIGDNSSYNYSIVIGINNHSYNSLNFIMGKNIIANNSSNLLLGNNISANSDNIIIGYNIDNKDSNICIGTFSNIETNLSILIGNSSNIKGNNIINIGNNSDNNNSNLIIIGNNNYSSVDDSIIIGNNINNNTFSLNIDDSILYKDGVIFIRKESEEQDIILNKDIINISTNLLSIGNITINNNSTLDTDNNYILPDLPDYNNNYLCYTKTSNLNLIWSNIKDLNIKEFIIKDTLTSADVLGYTITGNGNNIYNINLSEKSTDDLKEGARNLYYNKDVVNNFYNILIANAITSDNINSGTSNLYFNSNICNFIGLSNIYNNLSIDNIKSGTSNIYLNSNTYFSSNYKNYSNVNTDYINEGSNNSYYNKTLYINSNLVLTNFTSFNTDQLINGTSNIYYNINNILDLFTSLNIDDLLPGTYNLYLNSNIIIQEVDNFITTNDINIEIKEGTSNLFYSAGNFNNYLSNINTDNIKQGVHNYYLDNNYIINNDFIKNGNSNKFLINNYYDSNLFITGTLVLSCNINNVFSNINSRLMSMVPIENINENFINPLNVNLYPNEDTNINFNYYDDNNNLIEQSYCVFNIVDNFIGINTVNPRYELDVNGLISASNIILNNNLQGLPGTGDKIILASTETFPFSIGYETSNMWHSTPSWGSNNWYIGGSNILTITSNLVSINGNLILNDIILNNSSYLGNPTDGSSDDGTRIVLYSNEISNYRYAFGVSTNNLWYSVPEDAVHTWFCNGVNYMQLNTLGNLSVHGIVTDFNNASDEKLKKNIKPLGINCINLINEIKPVEFTWKNIEEVIKSKRDTEDCGFIAQELEKILPNIVQDATSYKTIEYEKIVPYLVKAFQEQTKIIEQLEKRINILENNIL